VFSAELQLQSSMAQWDAKEHGTHPMPPAPLAEASPRPVPVMGSYSLTPGQAHGIWEPKGRPSPGDAGSC